MKKLKAWWQKKSKLARQRKHLKWIREIGEKSPELLVNFITEKASEASIRMTMYILDREGIHHCKVCPSRFELRKLGPHYYCKPDYARVMATKQKEESASAVKAA